MKQADVDIIAAAIGPLLREQRGRLALLEQQLADLATRADARIGELERRVAEVESRASLADSYRGVFSDTESYSRGSLVTHSGSLFLALADTSARPATDDSWRMICKRGKDAR